MSVIRSLRRDNVTPLPKATRPVSSRQPRLGWDSWGYGYEGVA